MTDAESEVELRYAYARLVSDTIDRYALISPEEQAKVVFPKEVENELFAQIIANPWENCRNIAGGLRDQLNCVHNSVSFRIGRAITFLPRKVRDGVRHLRSLGASYTVHRAPYHIGLWKDKEAPKGGDDS